jgi:hypothetical protein
MQRPLVPTTNSDRRYAGCLKLFDGFQEISIRLYVSGLDPRLFEERLVVPNDLRV